MCGQCGLLASTIVSQEMRTFEVNLRMNIFRGRDSTGTVAVTAPTRIPGTKGKKDRYRPSRAVVWKEPRDAWAYLAFGDLDKKNIKGEIFTPAGKRLMMGHCRSATIGAVKAENAHPFVAGDIIGMHNGTIKKVFKGSDKYDTDSEALFNLINEVGVKEALQEVEGYSTAYALQFYDKAKNTFNVVRNSDRPLWFVYTKSRGALFWSSEEVDIRYAAKKTGLELEDKAFQPKPYELMTFDLLDPVPQKEFSVEDVTPKKAYITTPTYTRASAWDGKPTRYQSAVTSERRGDMEYLDNYKKRVNHRTGTVEYYYKNGWLLEEHYLMRLAQEHAEAEEMKQAFNDDIPIGKAETQKFTSSKGEKFHFLGFQNRVYLPHEFEKLMMSGCSNCNHQPDIRDPDIEYKIGWHNATQFFCETCTENEETKNFLVNFQLKREHNDESPFVESQVDPNEDT